MLINRHVYTSWHEEEICGLDVMVNCNSVVIKYPRRVEHIVRNTSREWKSRSPVMCHMKLQSYQMKRTHRKKLQPLEAALNSRWVRIWKDNDPATAKTQNWRSTIVLHCFSPFKQVLKRAVSLHNLTVHAVDIQLQIQSVGACFFLTNIQKQMDWKLVLNVATVHGRNVLEQLEEYHRSFCLLVELKYMYPDVSGMWDWYSK